MHPHPVRKKERVICIFFQQCWFQVHKCTLWKILQRCQSPLFKFHENWYIAILLSRTNCEKISWKLASLILHYYKHTKPSHKWFCNSVWLNSQKTDFCNIYFLNKTPANWKCEPILYSDTASAVSWLDIHVLSVNHFIFNLRGYSTLTNFVTVYAFL